jgi:hypothetical protein
VSCREALVPRTGDIVVTLSATGPDPDFEYAVSVNEQRPQRVRPDLSAKFTHLDPGNYTVRLDEAADNCEVGGENPRPAMVMAGAVTEVTFAVTCVATTGGIRVVSGTTGFEPDPDGYAVIIDDQPRGVVPANGSVTLNDVKRGTHTVRLDALAPNCTTTDSNLRSVLVLGGEITTVTFTTFCAATKGSLRVISTTTGLELDVDGYSLTLDGQPHGSVPANGNIPLFGITKGLHTVRLDDVAQNCAVAGENPRAVSIEPGVTTDVLYVITCRVLGSIRVSALSSGIDPDPNGYRVTVTRSAFKADSSLGNNSTTLFSRLVDADYLITLGGLAANCDADTPNPRSVTTTTGDTIAVLFKIACLSLTQLAFGTVDGNIAIVNSNGTGRRLLTDDPAFDQDPAWSPDGRRIAFASRQTISTEGPEIYVMNLDASGKVQLTNTPHASYQPAWSPDGSRIAFVSERDGNAEIYVMDADGSNLVRVTHDASTNTAPAWSPDGTQLAFASSLGIQVKNANGSDLRQLTTFPGDRHPEWSPDGTKLTFVRIQCESSFVCFPNIMVSQADGTAATVLAAGEQPTWSPDGKTIAYTALSCGNSYYYGFECIPAGIGMVRPNGSNVDLAVPGTGSYPAWRR